MKEIKLTKGYVALVDDEDYEYLNQWKWCATISKKNIYVKRNQYHKGDSKHKRLFSVVFMHRFIMKLNDKRLVVDHKDNNGLNNQKCNLRICTYSQNNAHTKKRTNSSSKYKGVRFIKDTNKWKSVVSMNKINVNIGVFNTEVEAALAYNKKALELHGDFAVLNIIN